MSDAKQPHDALFKAVFGNATRAAAQLRAALPASVAKHLDFSSLRLLPGSFIDERLRGTHSDLLFSVRCRERLAYLYVLFEHQSRSEPLMALRLLSYVVQILERHVETTRGRGPSLPLPLVVPIVLHHGPTSWRAATSMQELFGTNAASVPELAPYLPEFSFLLDDLSVVSDEGLAARNLDDFSVLALWALRDARRRDQLLASLAAWATVATRLAATNASALEQIFRYLLVVSPDLSLESILHTLRENAPTTEQSMTTIAERLMAEGESRGRVEGEARGRVEGEARGRVEGARRLLSRQLELRFGPVPAAIRGRLDAATEDEILRWSERVIQADSLADVIDG